MRARWPLAFALALLASACGDPLPVVDGGADAARDAAPIAFEVDPPAPPLSPALTPCAPGWRQVTRPDGLAACEPYAAAGPAPCDEVSLHVPGAPSCRRLGVACATDGVPTELPPGVPVVHVREDATGGDGTVGAPMGSIGEAVAAAPDGAIVAIAPGTYDEALVLTRPVTLWGACAERVLLTSSVPDDPVRAGVVTVEGSGVVVRNLTIGRSERPAVWAAVPAAEVELLDVVVAEADRVGIEVENGARLGARGIIVRDTKGGPTGQFGRGIGVQSGAVVEIREALLERNRETQAMSRTAGSLLVEDAVLRDGLPRASTERDGGGLYALAGGTARLVRALVVDNRTVGVSAMEEGSSVELEDVVIRGTRPQDADGLHGRGLNVQLGASMSATRVVVEESREIGVFASDGSTLHLENVLVAHTRARDDGVAGRGINVQLGATGVLSRVEISDSQEGGLGVVSAMVTATDLTVRRVLAALDGMGRGAYVQGDSTLVATRLHVEDAHGVGIQLTDAGATAAIEDCSVIRTRSLMSIVEARAIGVQSGGRAEITRLALEDNAQYGIVALDDGTALTLAHVSIADTRAGDCDPTRCFRAGTAIGVFRGGASVSATSVAVRGADLCGFHVADGTLDASDGEVSGCTVGACVQAEDFDVLRLSESVRYFDNGTNLDSTMLPVPGAVPDVEAE